MVERILVRIAVLLVVGVVTRCAIGSNSAAAENDPRWEQAVGLQTQEDYEAAAVLFHEIVAEYPRAQQAALQAALCEEKSNSQVALDSLAAAIEIDPFAYWAEIGLYRKAILHHELEDEADARVCIAQLRERFPDSRWTARAAVLEAELDGANVEAAEAILAREFAAEQVLKTANKDRSRANDTTRLGLLQQVVDEFGDTSSALSALDTQGHLLIRNGRKREAVDKFLYIVQRAEADAPQSRIVQTAHSRLAGLYHSMGRKQEALDVFSRLAEYGTDKSVVSNATLQAAGLYFELQQARKWAGEQPGADEWAEIRRRCQLVGDLDYAKAGEVARADLMIMETYLWDNQPRETLMRAEAYIADHDIPEYRRELATVHLFAGESLLRLSQFEEALGHFRWITDEYENNGNIWPWSYLTARTYYRVYDVLTRMGGSEFERKAAALVVLNDFADTNSADLLRTSLGISEGENVPLNNDPSSDEDEVPFEVTVSQ